MERQLDSSTLSLASPSSSGHHLADSWAKRAGRENANCSCSCGTRARISSECTSRLLPRSSHRMTPGSTEDQSCRVGECIVPFLLVIYGGEGQGSRRLRRIGNK